MKSAIIDVDVCAAIVTTSSIEFITHCSPIIFNYSTIFCRRLRWGFLPFTTNSSTAYVGMNGCKRHLSLLFWNVISAIFRVESAKKTSNKRILPLFGRFVCRYSIFRSTLWLSRLPTPFALFCLQLIVDCAHAREANFKLMKLASVNPAHRM